VYEPGVRGHFAPVIEPASSFFLSSGHSCGEHGKRHATVADLSKRSGSVISAGDSGFQQEDLGSGESFDNVHGALAEGTLPGGRLIRG
jgi:hypothetical protein